MPTVLIFSLWGCCCWNLEICMIDPLIHTHQKHDSTTTFWEFFGNFFKDKIMKDWCYHGCKWMVHMHFSATSHHLYTKAKSSLLRLDSLTEGEVFIHVFSTQIRENRIQDSNSSTSGSILKGINPPKAAETFKKWHSYVWDIVKI